MTVGVLLVRPSVATFAAELATEALRRCDIVGHLGLGRLGILLPEVIDTAEVPVRRLLLRIARRDPEVRAGLALCPTHGHAREALLQAAGQAAEAAAEGQLGWAAGDDVHFEIDGQIVLAVDPAMRRVFREVKRVAGSRMPVLITGETGSGKEAVARALHVWSDRAEGPWEAINFGAIPASLADAELFGAAGGAATEVKARAGLFEVADGGTLFIDELTEAPPGIQASLLRALQNGQIRRLGSTLVQHVDVRVVAATNQPPEAAIAAGALRADLYYRLEAARIEVPPLRHRPLDIPALARLFLGRHRPAGWPALRLAPEAERLLGTHRWPGNVRELENRMRYLAQTERGDRIDRAHVIRGEPSRVPVAPVRGVAPVDEAPEVFGPIEAEVEALYQRRMRQALIRAGGNRSEAARLLQMSRRTFHDRMKRYGLADEFRR